MLPKSLTKLLGFFHSKVQKHSEIKYYVVSVVRETNLLKTTLSAIIPGPCNLSETDAFPLMMLWLLKDCLLIISEYNNHITINCHQFILILFTSDASLISKLCCKFWRKQMDCWRQQNPMSCKSMLTFLRNCFIAGLFTLYRYLWY